MAKHDRAGSAKRSVGHDATGAAHADGKAAGATSSLPFPVVGVGASAGGLEAFSDLLRAQQVDAGVAFVLVQHLDPHHESLLSEILARDTTMPVKLVSSGMVVKPDHVYVIPPATSLVIHKGVLQLTPRTDGRGAVPYPIDHFLRSLAADQGHKAIGVVLSGSATDGTLGLEAIKAEGGITFAQDHTAQHGSMPRSAVASGCVDFVLPPAGIAKEIARIARHPYVGAGETPAALPAAEPDMSAVLRVLQQDTDVDFSNYKRNTLQRRIRRRVLLHRLDSVPEYVAFLQAHPEEVAALFQDILIRVTSFFRDPEAFEALKTVVFPRLTEDRSRNDPLRVWVQGCSTGEEAYSIAIAYAESCEESGRDVPLQLFATDLNGASIDRARIGVYPKSIASDVSTERLRRYFVDVDGSYRVTKAIRDRCVFAQHNVLTSPPFSNIDLVSCRNVLIYIEPVLQQRLMPLLHYALRPHGFLWLGASETIGSFRDLFELLEPRHKLYVRRPGPARMSGLIPVRRHEPAGPASPRPGAPLEGGIVPGDATREADRLLLTRYAPPGVLVSPDLEVLQFRGDTGPYLAPASGKATFNLLKMLREGLLVPVRDLIGRVRAEGRSARETGLRVKSDGGFRKVDVEVLPVDHERKGEGTLLVVFEDPADVVLDRARALREAAQMVRVPVDESGSAADVARLNQELASTREYLQSVIEQQEASNEELQSANEEVQSANEELQSINEELETSKEEIQSSNEELATVNDELQHRNLELSQSNNDLVNLLGSVQLAIVMLGPDLRIRRFTPIAEKLLNLIPADVGRPLSDIKLNLDVPGLQSLVEEVIDTVSVREREVQDRAGHWYSLRVRPYRTLDNHIDGAVLVLVDVDTIKRSQDNLRRLNDLLESTYEPIVMWDFDAGTLSYWNRGAEETYGWARAEAIGQQHDKLLGLPADQPDYREALRSRGQWSGELAHRRKAGDELDVESRMALVADGERSVVIESNRPITERKRVESALRLRAEDLLETDRKRNEFLAMLAHELRNPLAPMLNAMHVLRASDVAPAVVERSKTLMERQVRRLSRMVDDLLDVARITQGRIVLEREVVDAGELLRRVVEGHRPGAERRQLHLGLDLPPRTVWVNADPVRLEQVFDNLLHNACKFSSPHGHIQVTAAVEEVTRGKDGAGEHLVVRVKDDGIGIAPDMLPRVFELFAQADTSLNRAYGGLGIGLTLVRQLVTLHGGSVEVRSAGLGCGSEFTVRLPVSQPAPRTRPRDGAAGTARKQATPRRVLIVDDNVDSAESLAMLLRLDGHVAHVVFDAAAAIEEAHSLRPEVAILDIGLPARNGYELAGDLRGLPGLRDIRLVALTGYGREDDRRRGQEAGFDAYVVKPCDPEQIRQLVAQGSLRQTPPAASTLG